MPKKRASKSSGSASKPEAAPRPYTAYNVFFQLEREYILQRDLGVSPDLRPEDTFDPSDDGYEGPALPAKYLDVVLRCDWFVSGKTARTKRRHRASHGKISFVDLSKRIASSWRACDDDIKLFCAQVSDISMMNYRRQVIQRKKASSDGPKLAQPRDILPPRQTPMEGPGVPANAAGRSSSSALLPSLSADGSSHPPFAIGRDISGPRLNQAPRPTGTIGLGSMPNPFSAASTWSLPPRFPSLPAERGQAPGPISLGLAASTGPPSHAPRLPSYLAGEGDSEPGKGRAPTTLLGFGPTALAPGSLTFGSTTLADPPSLPSRAPDQFRLSLPLPNSASGSFSSSEVALTNPSQPNGVPGLVSLGSAALAGNPSLLPNFATGSVRFGSMAMADQPLLPNEAAGDSLRLGAATFANPLLANRVMDSISLGRATLGAATLANHPLLPIGAPGSLTLGSATMSNPSLQDGAPASLNVGPAALNDLSSLPNEASGTLGLGSAALGSLPLLPNETTDSIGLGVATLANPSLPTGATDSMSLGVTTLADPPLLPNVSQGLSTLGSATRPDPALHNRAPGSLSSGPALTLANPHSLPTWEPGLLSSGSAPTLASRPSLPRYGGPGSLGSGSSLPGPPALPNQMPGSLTLGSAASENSPLTPNPSTGSIGSGTEDQSRRRLSLGSNLPSLRTTGGPESLRRDRARRSISLGASALISPRIAGVGLPPASPLAEPPSLPPNASGSSSAPPHYRAQDPGGDAGGLVDMGNEEIYNIFMRAPEGP